ncbi:MAG TPA: NAD(P)-dependent alcohol dehydrogenase [Cytophagales bacterium]|nr:NAD(P)-dependent alcohol dehydrogenase [Cytophagales bacterium]HAP60401.1 NAD(P)-dependent alcohol dehydrogenase [Cytophagales bacterium]
MKALVVANRSVTLQNDLPVPTLKSNEVLVKIHYASVNSFDLETIEGKNDMLGKLMGAKKHPVQTGLEFAGVVETDGKRFKKGDRVYGYPHLTKGMKAHQEYLAINEDFLALMPPALGFAESAALPLGALTTLVGLESVGKIGPGAKVLIVGAAGGLGVYAVQIARIFKAEITAVAGPGQEDFLTELGAHRVVNYKEHSLQDLADRYDIILDLTTRVKFGEIKKLLSPKGVFVPANPFNQLSGLLGNAFRKQKTGWLMVDRGDHDQLTRIAQWVDEGKLKPIIDQIYPFAEYAEAFSKVTAPGKRGRMVLQIADEETT